MSLDASLTIANSGLAAVNAQLALISQNISNANTPGYVQETLPQTSQSADGQSEGVLTGVATRSVDLQLQQALWAQNATVSALATTQNGLQGVDAAQGTVAAGNDLGSALAAVDAAFVGLQGEPSSTAQQAQVVSAATTLATQINRLGQAYTDARQGAQDHLAQDVSALNGALHTVGSLSDQIIAARQRGQSSALLESQRDAALQTISGLVNVKTLAQPNGDVVITTAGGLTLPTRGTLALSLSPAVLGPDSARALGDVPGIMLGGQDVTTALAGGSIGADVTLRDVTLPTYQAELDEFSQTLTTRFADQGLALFTDATGAVPAGGGTPSQAGYVGYALGITVNPAVAANPALVRDGTTAIAGSPSGASAFTPNTDPGQTGFGVLIARVLSYALGAEAQPGVPQAPIATTGLGPAGTLDAPYAASTTLAAAASAVVGAQSADLANTTARLGTEQAVQGTLQSQFSAGTAVNMDQQLATMVQLQNAYGANAKIINAVQSMFSALLAAVA